MSINIHSIFAVKALCSEQMEQWINYHASLTDKLQQLKGEALLELMVQQWVNPDWWNKHLLKIQDEAVFQREIIMKSHGLIYWYAKSIIPKNCYDLDPVFFDRLKNESIKHLIFEDPRVQLSNRLSYPVDSQCMEFYWVKKYIHTIQGILWIRLAEFTFQQSASFYLVEILLPEMESLAS